MKTIQKACGLLGVLVGLGLTAVNSVVCANAAPGDGNPQNNTTTAYPGRTVVDATGKFVGYVFEMNQVQVPKESGGFVFFTGFSASGLAAVDSANVTFFFTSSNCVGQRYQDAPNLPPTGFVVGTAGSIVASGKLYYPGAPIKNVTLASYQSFASGDLTLSHPTCTAIPTTTVRMVGPTQTQNLVLGQPPFALE